ncbi:hypothetical protein [Agarivorans gilvus]|nr:hypothetical protein [Agarivorans gilvus]
MLSIITCIRHPATAKDFGRINELLQKTINSLHNQTALLINSVQRTQ